MTGGARASGVALLLLLAACGSGEDAADEAVPAPAERAAAPSAAPAMNTAAAARARPAPAKLHRGAEIAPDAEGLRLFDRATGAARPLPFGMPRQQLLALLERLLGPADRGSNAECGAGPIDHAAWADGLTLNFQAGRLVGWMLDPRGSGAHATVSGIGPGSTRRALDAAYDVKVEQSTLGTEFTAGALGGLLDGPTPAARITHLWAGIICTFR